MGLAIVSVRPEAGKLWVDNAYRQEQLEEGVAQRLLVFGLDEAPSVELNGRALERPGRERVDGGEAWGISLDTEP